LSGFYSMNALDVFYWTLAVCVLVRLLRTDRPRLWLGFGAVAGVALLNKISTGFLGFGVVVGLLLSTELLRTEVDLARRGDRPTALPAAHHLAGGSRLADRRVHRQRDPAQDPAHVAGHVPRESGALYY
jgi:hypothetical protein